MEVVIGVMSDLHCQPSTDRHIESLFFSDKPRLPSSQHPIQSLIEHIRDRQLRAQVLLVAGDFTNRMSQQGLCSAWPAVKDVATALSADLVAATLGNHDVDSRRKLASDPFQLPKNVYPDFPVTDQMARRSFWNDGFFVHDLNPLRVVGVNSVANHFDEKGAQHGGVSAAQLAALRQAIHNLAPRPFQIALMHHHPHPHEDLGLGTFDLMENGSLLLDVLGNAGFDLVVHGHKHSPRLSYSQGGATPPAVFAAGSLGALLGIAGTNTRNLFHLITLDDVAVPDCGKHGTITSWEFNLSVGWNPATVQSACVPHITGFGCRQQAAQLADAIAAWWTSQTIQLMEWSTVVAAHPQLRFLVPQDFRQVGRELLARHGITMQPSPPDVPQIVGHLHPGG